MAKLSLIQRELKREATVAKYAKKRAELLEIINDAKRSDEERYIARLEFQKLPRNAAPVRLRNRCNLTGPPAARSASLVWPVPRSASSPSRATSRA